MILNDKTCKVLITALEKVLATAVMMPAKGAECDNGMRYTRASGYGVVTTTVYTIGIVDIDEPWLHLLVADPKQRDAFERGDEHEFYGE